MSLHKDVPQDTVRRDVESDATASPSFREKAGSRSWLATLKTYLREPFAEFLGTCVVSSVSIACYIRCTRQAKPVSRWSCFSKE